MDYKEDEILNEGGEPDPTPLVALRGSVAFPGMLFDFITGREESEAAVNAALTGDRRILLVAQKDEKEESPAPKGLYRVGVLAGINQVLRGKEGARVLVQGISRVRISNPLPPGQSGFPFWTARYRVMPTYTREREDTSEMQAMMQVVQEEYEYYAQATNHVPREFVELILAEESPRRIFEGVWANSDIDYHDRQIMLEQNSVYDRLETLFHYFAKENSILEFKEYLRNDVQEHIEDGQREMYLREELRSITEALGESDAADFADYEEKINALPVSDEIKTKLLKDAQQLRKLPPGSSETYVVTTYLDVVLSLPWGVYTKEKVNIQKASEQLDKDHYGLKRVKERMLESMSVYALRHSLSGQIICLAGPPGVGKTSIAQSIAKALGRNYARVSLGGVRDEAEIRGHRKTYVGAMPGRIIDAVRQAGSMNPLILLDEIDKLSNDYKGDPSSALLEVLDSAQNQNFRDHYIEVPFDLSRVLFITTANDPDAIPAPLYDRMEVIELNSYTREEKFHIAKEHLLKKQIAQNGLRASQIKITDDAIYELIDSYTKEAGVRQLERQIGSLCRKCAKSILTEDVQKVRYTAKNLGNALGPRKFSGDYFSEKDSVGLVNGLAWTSAGGVVMPLEVLLMEGKGEIRLTGSLGDVMKESAQIAVSYARAVAKEYEISPELFKTRDIHIHAPEGAVPKDGPSAGVTMLTALISALSGIPVRHDVAMTGEITLHGKVLPIGGLVEKSMAAYKNGIHTVLIPAANEPDLAEIDEAVRSQIRFIPCETVETVLQTALIPPHYDTVLEPLTPAETTMHIRTHRTRRPGLGSTAS